MTTKGRARRIARREKRTAKRTAKPQYLGGSKEAESRLLDTAEEETAAAREARTTARDRLTDVAERASALEGMTGKDYATTKSDAAASRGALQSAIGGIGTGAKSAIDLRNEALAANDLNKIAETGIRANEDVAQQRLAQQVGLIQRGARGLASGMGEGSALAMQQAIASSGQSAADLAAQDAVTRAETAATMRDTAARQQVANALAAADANAGLTYQAGQDTASATQALNAADQAARDAATSRQLGLLGARSQAVGAAADAALGASGQEIGSQGSLLGGQVSAAQTNEQARLASNEANSLASKFARFRTATSGGLLK